MSRLIELLLNEDVATSTATINGQHHKFHTDAGNLFRLLLVFNPNQPIPQIGSTTLINKMLPTISKEKEYKDAFKLLKTEFNKIAAPTKGKPGTRKKVSRLKYYDALFRLLLPMLKGKERFRITTLKTLFKNDDNVDLQRKTTILIGKALIAAHQDNDLPVELNSKDIVLIKGYIIGLEALDDELSDAPLSQQPTEISPPAPEQTQEKQPVNSVTKVVNSEKTTEDLEKIKEQTTEVIDNVRQLQKDNSNEISTLLKTNEMSSTFNVQLTDRDAPVQPIVNKSIEETYSRVKAEFGKETANFVGKYVSDHFKQLNTLNGYLNFLNSNSVLEPRINVEPVEGGFKVKTEVASNRIPSEHKFSVEAIFTDDAAGNMNVRWEKLQIPKSAQASGIARKIFKDNLELYKAQGVNKISLEANEDVGGYAWFRFGFIPKDVTEIEKISRWIREISQVANQALPVKEDNEIFAKFILDKSHTVSKGVQNLSDLVKSGDKSVGNVIIKLFDKCANEFQETFDSKEKFKELGKNIAIMNFKEYNINGKPYSISYKALLSMYTINNSDDMQFFPMNSQFISRRLGWEGELDMNDLDDTYAYLNI